MVPENPVHVRGSRKMKRPRRIDSRILNLSKNISRRLVAGGASSVVLAGSWARSDAHDDSDIDLWAIGKNSRYRLERIDGFLVAISERTPSQFRKEFKDPARAGGAVPGWREARILFGSSGLAKRMKRDAERWTWDLIATKCNEWVADQVTGYAEEVCKLVGNLRLGRKWAAAVQRSLLAIRMAPILAVHLRILYGSENGLWDLVGESMGHEWKKLQRAAFSEGKTTFVESCEAALQLYAVAASSIRSLLSERQQAVVAYACKLAKRPLA